LLCLTRTKHAAAPMATTSRAPTGTSLQLPRPIEPTKPLASEPCGPQTANLPLRAPTFHPFVRTLCSKWRRPPQANLHSPNSRPAVQCNEGFRDASEGQRFVLTTNSASQKPHNYAHGRSPTKTRCDTGISAVNEGLRAAKPCTQPARAAFNPAPMVNIRLATRIEFGSTHQARLRSPNSSYAIVTPETCAASRLLPALRRSARAP